MPTPELAEIKKILDQHERRISALENDATIAPSSSKKPLSVREFILQKKPKNDVQKTLYFGYFLEHNKGTSPFNVDDLEKSFREAKEPVPENINDKVSWNIKKGFMMEAEGKKDKKKAWTLTGTGEKKVEDQVRNEDC